MGKKSDRRVKKEEAVDTGGGDALKHNPFAALKGAAGGLPEGPAPKPKPPAEGTTTGKHPGLGKLVVRREKKGRGGKTVTRIEGLPEARLEELAKRMKKALGCGASVEGADLVLLGELPDRAVAWLRDEGASRVVRGS